MKPIAAVLLTFVLSAAAGLALFYFVGIYNYSVWLVVVSLIIPSGYAALNVLLGETIIEDGVKAVIMIVCFSFLLTVKHGRYSVIFWIILTSICIGMTANQIAKKRIRLSRAN